MHLVSSASQAGLSYSSTPSRERRTISFTGGERGAPPRLLPLLLQCVLIQALLLLLLLLLLLWLLLGLRVVGLLLLLLLLLQRI